MAESHEIWLGIAQDDLAWAKASLRGGFWRGACFTCQQAVEKALKAFLLYQQASPPRIHDLVALSKECRRFDPTFQVIVDACRALSPYYLSSRYPDLAELEEYSKEKADNAIAQTEAVLAFVKSKIPGETP